MVRAGGLDDPLLGVEHPLAGVVVGSGVAVDADAIGPTKGLGVDDRVEVGRQVDQRTGDRVDEVLDDLADLIARYVELADLALRFGIDVPGLPGRAMRLELGDHPLGCFGQPRRWKPACEGWVSG